jgi:hypothetical protein
MWAPGVRRETWSPHHRQENAVRGEQFVPALPRRDEQPNPITFLVLLVPAKPVSWKLRPKYF